ncbi:MAG: DUF262 domain-containing protein [Candidatus Dormibacteria bacterium]
MNDANDDLLTTNTPGDDLADSIDLGTDDEVDDALPPLEKKYQAQMRQIVTQKLDLPVSALLAMLKDQIRLNPEFQRRDRWNEARQSRWIESLVMNVPIPPVFLGEDEYGQYVVLDGRQRLTAISKFLNNEFMLHDLQVWDDLNGLTFQAMVKRDLDKYLTRRFIPAVVILKESSSVVKYDVFDRLNTGGIEANDMEIRNAVLRGKFTDLLQILSRTPAFCDLWNIPTDPVDAENHPLYQQMRDLELVLRFFALSEHESMTVSFKDYLSDFMEARNKTYIERPDQEQLDRDRFLRAVKTCWRIFGQEAFYKPYKDGKHQRSFPLADALMVAFADYEPETITDAQAASARDLVSELFKHADFQKAIGTGTNGRRAIATRVDLAREAAQKALT